MNPLSPDYLTAAAANLFDATFRGGLADLRALPASIIEEAPHRTVFHYVRPDPLPARAMRCCWCLPWPPRRPASTCGAAAASPST